MYGVRVREGWGRFEGSISLMRAVYIYSIHDYDHYMYVLNTSQKVVSVLNASSDAASRLDGEVSCPARRAMIVLTHYVTVVSRLLIYSLILPVHA